MIGPESTTVPSKSKRTTGKRTPPIVATGSEPKRLAQLVEQGAPKRRRRLDERCDARGLFLGQRDRRFRLVAGPDAEADLRMRRLVAEVAGDAQRLVGIAGHPGVRREELDQLAPLRHGAPGAVAEPVLDAVPTVAARVHLPILCPQAPRTNR